MTPRAFIIPTLLHTEVQKHLGGDMWNSADAAMGDQLTKPSEGWAAELTGSAVDLSDLREMLAAPFEPWVEEYEFDGETVLLLRSVEWKGLNDAAELNERARLLLTRINGAKRIAFEDSRTVALGRTFRFDADGALLPFTLSMLVQASIGEIRSRARGRLDDGLPKVPAPSPLQARLKAAEDSERHADLLTHIARADNWYDLYKAMEQVEQINGTGKATSARRIGGTIAGQDEDVPAIGAAWQTRPRASPFRK